jgi:hypothetical protein
MSATLTESLTWDRMTAEQKRASAAKFVPGAYYGLHCGSWGTAVLRCLNVETSQFRVISFTPNEAGEQDMTGWLVTVQPEVQAKLCRISAP